MDLTTLTDTEIDTLLQDVIAERNRRVILATAPQKADQLSRQVLSAEGVVQGEQWRQPEGAHDAYPLGWHVTLDGDEWESLTPANVWQPGVSGWRQIGSDGPAPWVQPTGSHDAYQTGDRVLFDGRVFESSIDGNVWSPTDHPAGWTEIH